MFQQLTDQQLAVLGHMLGRANLAIWEARHDTGSPGYAALLRETSLLVREVDGELAGRAWRATDSLRGNSDA